MIEYNVPCQTYVSQVAVVFIADLVLHTQVSDPLDTPPLFPSSFGPHFVQGQILSLVSNISSGMESGKESLMNPEDVLRAIGAAAALLPHAPQEQDEDREAIAVLQVISTILTGFGHPPP